jgi:hypothetical protein
VRSTVLGLKINSNSVVGSIGNLNLWACEDCRADQHVPGERERAHQRWPIHLDRVPELMVGSAEAPAFLAPPAISHTRYPTSA